MCMCVWMCSSPGEKTRAGATPEAQTHLEGSLTSSEQAPYFRRDGGCERSTGARTSLLQFRRPQLTCVLPPQVRFHFRFSLRSAVATVSHSHSLLELLGHLVFPPCLSSVLHLTFLYSARASHRRLTISSLTMPQSLFSTICCLLH